VRRQNTEANGNEKKKTRNVVLSGLRVSLSASLYKCLTNVNLAHTLCDDMK